MSLLDEVVIQGVRQSLQGSIAKALAGGISGSIGGLVSGGMLNGLTFSDPHLQETVRNLQGKLGEQPAAPPPQPAPAAPAAPAANEVAPITITAASGAPVPAAGALGQVIAGGAGANVAQGFAGTDNLSGQQQADGGDQQKSNEVEGVTVTAAKQPSSISPAAVVLPAGAAGAALLSAGGGGTPAVATEPVTTVDPVEVTAAPPPNPMFTPTDAMLAAGGLGAGTLLAGSGGGNGGIAGTGVTVPQVVAGGILAGGLLSGPGDATDGVGGTGLKGLADSSSALADRLGNVATAGFSGNIGGMGLNTINRMVKKSQAAIRQRYAAMGMSGSTAEGQDLQAAADAGVDLQFKIGQEMASTGLNAIAALTGQSAQIYTQLLNAQTSKDTALGNALANFAGSLVH